MQLPQYALPDLANMLPNRSWIFAVTKSHNRYHDALHLPTFDLPEYSPGNVLLPAPARPYRSILGDYDYVYTYQGLFHRSVLKSVSRSRDANSDDEAAASVSSPDSVGPSDDSVLPTDVGSRIGILYVVTGDGETAEMHFILNGEDQGPCARGIPYKTAPLYAVVDVYGTTKQIRIVQLSCGLYICTLF